MVNCNTRNEVEIHASLSEQRMSAELARKLSKRQRECLMLVLENQQTKDIARTLGVAPSTVKNHIKGAMATLGVSSRVKAARLVAGQDTSPRGTSAPWVIGESDNLAATPSGSASLPTDEVSYLREEHRLFDEGFATPIGTDVGTLDEGRRYHLSIGKRLGLIVMMSVGLAVCFGGLLAGLDALSNLFRS